MKDHLKRIKESGDKSLGMRKLYSYTQMDLPCNEVTDLYPTMDLIMHDIHEIIGVVYDQPEAAAQLRPRSWKEPHLLLYQNLRGRP
jgi:hypothetical protein